MPASLRPDIAFDAGATLGEGPVWDEERQRLLWLDILPGLVHLDERQLAAQPHAGAVFAVDVGARGLPGLRFAG
jgi:sugar lactone lactonase YvrE